jgi:hypothetical protein
MHVGRGGEGGARKGRTKNVTTINTDAEPHLQENSLYLKYCATYLFPIPAVLRYLPIPYTCSTALLAYSLYLQYCATYLFPIPAVLRYLHIPYTCSTALPTYSLYLKYCATYIFPIPAVLRYLPILYT